MCFSANASFTAAVVIGAVGLYALSQAKTLPWRLLALVPIIFALQQAVEGGVWLTFDWGLTAKPIHEILIYIFYIIATMVWPVYLPIVIYKLEKNDKRKRGIAWLRLISFFYLFAIIFYLTTHGVRADTHSGHITYAPLWEKPYDTALQIALHIVYLILTIGALALSSVPGMIWITLTLIVATIVAYIFYWFSFASVWCYFGAIISLLILLIISKQKKLR